MRVATGGISHETRTFTPVPTDLSSFQKRAPLRGPLILNAFEGTNTPIGGFVQGAREHGFELIPTLFAESHPSAPPPRSLFDDLLHELLEGIRGAAPLDGVLLDLHGSMVVGPVGATGSLDDPEGHLLGAVREVVGPSVPIVAQLDIHSNVSQTMVDVADVLVGRQSYPETAMAARGQACADILMRMHGEGLRPTMALHQIPMTWGMNQVTAHAPMREAIAELHRIEAMPGVVCASIATCFPLADVPDMGASVYVATDDDRQSAQRLADDLGTWLYERRAEWHRRLASTREILGTLASDAPLPLLLADRNDNTGGGAPGDSTGMLQAFVEADLQDACLLYVVDPESIAACHDAGLGARVDLRIGGKASKLQGEPVALQVEVVGVSRGRFRYDGPMYAGMEGNMGPSAYVRAGGLHIVMVTTREQPYDTAFSRSLGLDPRQMRYIGVKSAAHYRTAFEPWAGTIHEVGEPSVHDAANITFERLGRSLYPFA